MMLGYSEIDIGVLDIIVRTIEFGKYRGVLVSNMVANSILTTMFGRSWFSYKDKWKVINLFIHLINRLCYMS